MKTTKVLTTTLALGMTTLMSNVAYASETSDALNLISGIDGVSGGSNQIMTLVTNLINWAVGLAALVCVVILIVSGYKYITASGDENKIQSATKTLTFAIIGLVVCFIAVILVKFVLARIGIGTAS